MEVENPSHGETHNSPPPLHSFFPVETVDGSSSAASTPFVSAPSSPGRAATAGGYFFSCPASPVHYVLASPPYSISSAAAPIAGEEASASGSFEFDGAAPGGTMISADELFLNGKIRPLKLSSDLRSQPLAPLMDLDDEDDDDDAETEEMTGYVEREEGRRGRDLRIRSRSIHRRARSMSPLRSPRFQWHGDEDEKQEATEELQVDPDLKETVTQPEITSSSRSSSSSGSRSSKWIFLKDLLYRSKSEGSGRGTGKEKEKFWHSISFSPSSKSKPPLPSSAASPPPAAPSPAAEQNKTKQSKRPANGVGRRRGTAAAAHERLYTTNRAQAEEMRRRTFLPYRQGLLGCLGFTSRSYGAFNGLAKALNPVTSR
ncbi:hypothetical protein Cni_G19049 [Canna indica]|uniref:Calmodulin-binding protein n=1 Tax=Canna indica TaxID=4628 RepID=A0AAQ3KLG7_9LILI|nr:hypothetical protein Cni_G19049 [Canna indica]